MPIPAPATARLVEGPARGTGSLRRRAHHPHGGPPHRRRRREPGVPCRPCASCASGALAPGSRMTAALQRPPGLDRRGGVGRSPTALTGDLEAGPPASSDGPRPRDPPRRRAPPRPWACSCGEARSKGRAPWTWSIFTGVGKKGRPVHGVTASSSCPTASPAPSWTFSSATAPPWGCACVRQERVCLDRRFETVEVDGHAVAVKLGYWEGRSGPRGTRVRGLRRRGPRHGAVPRRRCNTRHDRVYSVRGGWPRKARSRGWVALEPRNAGICSSWTTRRTSAC